MFYYFLGAPSKRAFLGSQIAEQFIHKLTYYLQLLPAEETSY
jgi:hypothetical protein